MLFCLGVFAGGILVVLLYVCRLSCLKEVCYVHWVLCWYFWICCLEWVLRDCLGWCFIDLFVGVDAVRFVGCLLFSFACVVEGLT